VRALVVPTRIERKALFRALPSPLPLPEWAVPAWRAGELLVLKCGVGPARAEALLPHLGRALPEALWLVGWCGGLRKELRVGDVVLAEATLTATTPGMAVIDHPPPQALVDWLDAWAAACGQHLVVAPALTSARVLAHAVDKHAAAATGAAAVEMEAAPLAKWAVERDVPFRHLRVVLDPLASNLPAASRPRTGEELHNEGDDGGGTGRYVRRALWHPRTWPAVWRLQRQIRVASRVLTSLGAVLTSLDGPLGAGC
jgi:hypothetical protein